MRSLAIDSRLDAIAGKPAGMQVGAGSVQLSGFGQYGARSLFVVYDVFDSVSNDGNAPLAGIGAIGSSTEQIRFQSSPFANAWSFRFRTRPNNTDTLSVGTSGSTIGRHVAAGWLIDGLATFGGVVDRLPAATGSLIAGDGLEDETILYVTSTPHTYAKPLLAAAYPAVHTEYQRTAIMHKLLQMSGGGGRLCSLLLAPLRRRNLRLAA